MAGKVLSGVILIALILPGLAYGMHPGHSPQSFGNDSSFSPLNGGYASFTVYADSVSTGLLSALNSYTHRWNSSASVYGNMIQVAVPSAFAGAASAYLSSISTTYGLSYFRDNSSSIFQPYGLFSRLSSSDSTPSQAYLPHTIYSAYNYTYANQHNLTGSGSTIAIIDAYGDPYLAYDLSVFDNISSLPAVSLTIHYLNKTPLQYNKSWALETAMDVEWAHASAPGASIVLIIAQNSGPALTDALSYAVSSRAGNIISLSWGAPEKSVINQTGQSGLTSLSKIYMQAARENITVFAASGDNGAYDGTGSLAVNYPASDPFVTGVGGTSLFTYQGTYSEKAWGGSNSLGTFGSGGGFSSVFGAPSWQKAPNFNSTSRGVPDVSAVADKYTGVMVIFGGDAYEAGGTSLSTPIWSGIAARLNQYAHTSLGFLNPLLYQISRTSLYNSSFNQISKGTNGYYTASTGWDPVTGLGSPNVTGLMKSLTQITGNYGFTVTSNGSYSSSGIEATLEIPSSAVSPPVNATFHYFVTLNLNSSHYLRFGIAINETGIYALTTMRNGTMMDNSSTILQKYPYPSENMKIEVRMNGYSINLTAGQFQKSERFFLPFSGSANLGIGASVSGSYTNTSIAPQVNFTNIRPINSTSWNSSTVLYETHFAGISKEPSYSSITGVFENGTVYVRNGGKQLNGFVTKARQLNPEIIYTADYSNPVKLNFSLSGTTANATSWYFDGSRLQGSTATVAVSGSYNVTATTPGGNISRTVYVEATSSAMLKLKNPVAGYAATVNVTINSIWEKHLTVYSNYTLNFTAITGGNTIKVVTAGYRTARVSASDGTLTTVSLIPVEPVVSIFVSPGSASVSLNSLSIQGKRGYFSSVVNPGTVTVNITNPGYAGYSEKVFVGPGQRLSEEVHLTPPNGSGLIPVSGIVRNAAFYFGLSSVYVYLNNTTFTYTNSTGKYSLYLPAGNYSLQFSLPLYNTTSSEFNLTSNRTLNIDLYGIGLNSIPYYSISVNYAFPLLFFLLYLSWSSKTPVSDYVVYLSASQSFNTYTRINVSGSQSFAILDIIPLKTYYVQIFGYTSLGKIVSSNEIIVSGTNTLSLVINSVLVSGLAIYAFFAVKYIRKAFSRKKRI